MQAGSMVCERSNTHYVLAIEGVANEFPHVRFRARRVTLVDDFSRPRCRVLHHFARGLNDAPYVRRKPTNVFGNSYLYGHRFSLGETFSDGRFAA